MPSRACLVSHPRSILNQLCCCLGAAARPRATRRVLSDTTLDGVRGPVFARTLAKLTQLKTLNLASEWRVLAAVCALYLSLPSTSYHARVSHPQLVPHCVAAAAVVIDLSVACAVGVVCAQTTTLVTQ